MAFSFVYSSDSPIIDNSWASQSQILILWELWNKPSRISTAARLSCQCFVMDLHSLKSCHVLEIVRMKTIVSKTRTKMDAATLTANSFKIFLQWLSCVAWLPTSVESPACVHEYMSIIQTVGYTLYQSQELMLNKIQIVRMEEALSEWWSGRSCQTMQYHKQHWKISKKIWYPHQSQGNSRNP